MGVWFRTWFHWIALVAWVLAAAAVLARHVYVFGIGDFM